MMLLMLFCFPRPTPPPSFIFFLSGDEEGLLYLDVYDV